MTMENKICLVTGATDGIGFVTAKVLAQQGARVFIHGRNAEKGARCVEQIKQATGNNAVSFLLADFASLEQVRAVAATLNSSIDKLDLLVNNAGSASHATRELSKDGYELTFAANHLAPFLLTNLLLDKIRLAPHARIVNVSSTAHKIKPFDIDDLMSERISPIYAYGRSKFANILFSNELAKRLSGTGITSNALHPGVVRTGFGKEATISRIFYMLAAPFLKTPEQGAATNIYLAISTEVENKSGGYYANCKLAEPDASTKTPGLAERLWRESEQLVGLV
ncbi:MAG: hypothetical protein JWM78_1078 [Verrucomicrobiaceae bacterium]|nr:hypothetical protein [Verrucomicrobiaceae bacterium]